MSNLGIRLDNFRAKSLKTHEHKMRMVGPGDFEPIRAVKSIALRCDN